MHLQRETKLAASWRDDPLRSRHAPSECGHDKIFSPRAQMLLDNFLGLEPCYQGRPLKEHNGSSVSSNPLAANQAHFASLDILQSKKTHQIVDWFPIVLAAIIFHLFDCATKIGLKRFETSSRPVIHHSKQHAAFDFVRDTVHLHRMLLSIASVFEDNN